MLPILADAFIRASLQRPLHERRWDAPKHWRDPASKVHNSGAKKEVEND